MARAGSPPGAKRKGRVAAPAVERDANYLRGVLLVVAGGVCLSTGGTILRFFEQADGWQIVFYRSIGFVITLLAFLALRNRGRLGASFRAVGWPGVIVAVALGLGTASYVFAMLLTTVANVVFTVAIGPFLAAALGWFVLRERVGLVTWLAMAMAAGGVGLMFADGLASGTWLGNLVALGPPLTLAVTVVAWRWDRRVDMVPATCLSGAVGFLIGAAMADGVAIPAHEMALALLLGGGQVGAGFLLFTLGSRWVPSGEVPLFGLTETVLAPLWVWLIVSEVPSTLSLAGGAVVLLAVVSAAVSGLRAAEAKR